MINAFCLICAVFSNLNGHPCYKFINFKWLCYIIICPGKEQIYLCI